MEQDTILVGREISRTILGMGVAPDRHSFFGHSGISDPEIGFPVGICSAVSMLDRPRKSIADVGRFKAMRSLIAASISGGQRWGGGGVLGAALAVIMLLLPSSVGAQSEIPISEMWIVDDGVRAMISDGATLHIGVKVPGTHLRTCGESAQIGNITSVTKYVAGTFSPGSDQWGILWAFYSGSPARPDSSKDAGRPFSD
jgi:hypothetical protein